MKSKKMKSLFIIGLFSVITLNLSIIFGDNNDTSKIELKSVEVLANEGIYERDPFYIKEKQTITCTNGGTKTACVDKLVSYYNGTQCSTSDETECTASCAETGEHEFGSSTAAYRYCTKVGCSYSEPIENDDNGNGGDNGNGDSCVHAWTEVGAIRICSKCQAEKTNINYCSVTQGSHRISDGRCINCGQVIN